MNHKFGRFLPLMLCSIAVGGILVAWLVHKVTANDAPKIVVCIDPGHPSETNSGRLVQNGSSELEINWQVATKLKKELEKDGRIEVIKTRDSMDEFTRNRNRALIANDHHAALTIHLHCDAGPNHGFTVYYPDGEGEAEGQTGPSPDVLQSSHKAALALHEGMSKVLIGKLKDRGVKGESFTRVGKANGALTTSVFSEVPTVTVEMVFLSNKNDAKFIESDKGQAKMVAALTAGIKNYLKPPT